MSPSVLVVDDDAAIRTLVVRALEREGFTVTAAADGEAGWEAILRERPAVVVVDWMMPGLDGPGLCRRIRESDALAAVYVILLTAKERTDDKVAGLDAGADDFLVKPVPMEELAARVRTGARIAGLQRELQERAERLEALDREKDRFLAMAAHDLRNPLGIISLWAEMLEEEADLPEDAREGVTVIGRHAARMRRLIDDLLDVNRNEIGGNPRDDMTEDPGT